MFTEPFVTECSIDQVFGSRLIHMSSGGFDLRLDSPDIITKCGFFLNLSVLCHSLFHALQPAADVPASRGYRLNLSFLNTRELHRQDCTPLPRAAACVFFHAFAAHDPLLASAKRLACWAKTPDTSLLLASLRRSDSLKCGRNFMARAMGVFGLEVRFTFMV